MSIGTIFVDAREIYARNQRPNAFISHIDQATRRKLIERKVSITGSADEPTLDESERLRAVARLIEAGSGDLPPHAELADASRPYPALIDGTMVHTISLVFVI